MDKVEISGWERSKISNQDQKTLKKLGLLKKQDSLILPGDESFPCPPIGYRINFIDHLIRGLSTPIHEFLQGFLFVYGIQLHQLTPNSILHISIFITLCECFLGTHPYWGLWKRIFYLRRNNSRNFVYNVGGVCNCIRPDVDYFDVKFPDSVQGWRRRWLYIQEEYVNSQEYGIAPCDGAVEILRRRSWDAEVTAEEKMATEALMKRIHQLPNTHGEEMSGVQITAYFLRIRVQPLQARKNPLWMYAGEKDVDRVSKDLSVKDLERLIRRFSSLSKKYEVPTSCRVEPYNGSHALPETQPKIFSELVKRFRGEEDPALVYRQENLKVGVEGTIALVADSRQDVDWAKVGDPKGMNKEKCKTLVKKPHSKKILAFLGHKPAASASTAKPEDMSRFWIRCSRSCSGLVTPSYRSAKTFQTEVDLSMKSKLSTLSESLLISEFAYDPKDMLPKMSASFRLKRA
ncbi:hypothetical protein QYE76_009701 [Lolium multiflorum]|uniref:Transposase (putative) gypsy type domain-containing protein n=1 Tax=Lolium multiflorum TaxID=4521 RepID=A0AAD8X3U2_LOLMU|nr:hypothetical protein QYE76_009701 [Lolium multiflorum]